MLRGVVGRAPGGVEPATSSAVWSRPSRRGLHRNQSAQSIEPRRTQRRLKFHANNAEEVGSVQPASAPIFTIVGLRLTNATPSNGGLARPVRFRPFEIVSGMCQVAASGTPIFGTYAGLIRGL
jgi:hypothetical protein